MERCRFKRYQEAVSTCRREYSSLRAKRRRQKAAPKQARCVLSDPAAAAIKPDARCGSCGQFSGCFMALADWHVVSGQTRNGASSSADRECDDDEGPGETLPRAKCRRVGVEEEYPNGVTETKCWDGTKIGCPFCVVSWSRPVRRPGTGSGFGTGHCECPVENDTTAEASTSPVMSMCCSRKKVQETLGNAYTMLTGHQHDLRLRRTWPTRSQQKQNSHATKRHARHKCPINSS